MPEVYFTIGRLYYFSALFLSCILFAISLILLKYNSKIDKVLLSITLFCTVMISGTIVYDNLLPNTRFSYHSGAFFTAMSALFYNEFMARYFNLRPKMIWALRALGAAFILGQIAFMVDLVADLGIGRLFIIDQKLAIPYSIDISGTDIDLGPFSKTMLGLMTLMGTFLTVYWVPQAYKKGLWLLMAGMLISIIAPFWDMVTMTAPITYGFLLAPWANAIEYIRINFETIRDEIRNRYKAEQELATQKRINLENLVGTSAGLAHEINTPLATGMMSLSLLERATEGNEKSKMLFSNLSTSLNRISTIVKSVQLIASADKYSKKVSLVEVDKIYSMINEISRDHPQVSFSTDFGVAKDKKIEVHKVELVLQSLKNVLNNAIEAALESDGKRVDVSVIDSGNSIQVLVYNSGKELTEEVKNKLFVPFFTTKSMDGSHPGLGLTVAKFILESCDAKLELKENQPNKIGFEVEFKEAA